MIFMNYVLEPILETEDNMTLGRAVAVAAWRYERGKTKKKSSFVYDINRFRREFASDGLREHTKIQFDKGDYSRLAYEMLDEIKAHAEFLAPDHGERHPFYACSRIISDPESGFARLGEETRKAIMGGRTHITDFVKYLAEVAKN
jgi:hypothetical protein